MMSSATPRICKNCGEPVPPRRRLYCSDECRDRWYENHLWGWAVEAALKAADYTCFDCGAKHSKVYGGLVVHHLEPLSGEERRRNDLNNQTNLIVLCRSCHALRHSKKQARLRALAALQGRFF